MPPTTAFDYSIHPSSTLSSVPMTPAFPGQPPLETLPDLLVNAEQPHNRHETKTRVFNYYFLFLALLAVALAALFWWLHRQRRQEQERTRSRGQLALAWDAERWAISRRNQPPIVEGLNESGEAPPPYKPKDDTVTTLEPLNGDAELAVDVTAPPRALSRNETGHARPPEYVEIIHFEDDSSTELARTVVQLTPPHVGGNAT